MCIVKSIRYQASETLQAIPVKMLGERLDSGSWFLTPQDAKIARINGTLGSLVTQVARIQGHVSSFAFNSVGKRTSVAPSS